MLAVLDAVLSTGFGTSAVTSLSVTGTVATLTLPTGHSMIPNCVALISGATPAGLNGEKRIIATSGTTATFDATGTAEGSATGTIAVKVAPLGWTKTFTGTNLAAYKMTDVQGTGFFLRVDDTGNTTARVRGFEAMSDVNTGTGLFPSLPQSSGSGHFWSKSNAADGSARPWYVLGDSRGFYLFVNNYVGSSEYQSYYFGDVISLKSNDPYACVLRGNIANRSDSSGLVSEDLGYADATTSIGGMHIARVSNTLGGSVSAFSSPSLSIGLPLHHTIGGQGWAYPSPVDNGLILSALMLYQASLGYRGYFPGLRTSPQYVGSSFATGDYVAGTGVMAGKKVLVIKLGSTTPGVSQAVLFMDPISDWRI